MAKTDKTKKDITLETGFFAYLHRYYQYNKRRIRQSYRKITKKFLDYNEDNFLREPQFEALEMYIFIKEYLENKQVYQIFDEYYHKKGNFEHQEEYSLLESRLEEVQDKDYAELFKEMRKSSRIYPNYIYALTMGTGKTILMATCIFYEFILANKFPKDENYCHNALVLAPDKTVLQALREIETFDKSLVVPEEYVSWLDMNLKIHFLDDPNVTLNVIDDSSFNIIISNTQKIILKRQTKEKLAYEKLFTDNTEAPNEDASTSDTFDQLADDLYSVKLESEEELSTNQRFQKLTRMSQLGIFLDEAHHVFGTKLRKDMEAKKSDKTSLRNTIDQLAAELKDRGTKVVACYNYTGTPYIQNKLLPEVVYTYGLRQAIYNEFLKKVECHSYSNPTSKDFLRFVIKDFWEKYGNNRYEDMSPKLALFASKIDEIEGELRPHVEEILSEMGIPLDKILVNVGDDKLTSNDDIREFNNLDTPGSDKQFILLVNKGKEGWNCRSLFGVGLYRKPKSKIFVLQATMRCMRSISDVQQTANVYLSDENFTILESELQENFKVKVQDLNTKDDKEVYQINLVPPPVKFTIKRRKKKYDLQEKKQTAALDLKLNTIDYDRYKVIETVRDGIDKTKKVKDKIDRTGEREKRRFSEITLVAELSRYLNKSCIEIRKTLTESKEGIEEILNKVNNFNEILYDFIVPELFRYYFEVMDYSREEEEEIELTKDPGDEGYKITSKPDMMEDSELHKNILDKTFHLTKYCFDSMPEKDFFWKLVKEDKVKKVYFTGMLTNKHTNFNIHYIDPESNRLRTYFPDFIVQNDQDEWIIYEIKGEHQIDNAVVQAKASYARTMATVNNWKYEIVPSKAI